MQLSLDSALQVPSGDALADVLRATAGLVDEDAKKVHHGGWNAGPAVWGLVFEAAAQVYSLPAAEVLRRHLGLSQLQDWNNVGLAEAAQAIRDCADKVSAAPPDLADAALAAYQADIREMRDVLHRALYGRPAVYHTPMQIVADAAETIARQRARIAQLEHELQLQRKAPCPGGRRMTPTVPTPRGS